MSNARNLANLLGTNSTIQTAKIADDAITNAKINDSDSFTVGELTVSGASTFQGAATATSTTAGFGAFDKIILNATDGSATDAGSALLLNQTAAAGTDDGDEILFETATGDPNELLSSTNTNLPALNFTGMPTINTSNQTSSNEDKSSLGALVHLFTHVHNSPVSKIVITGKSLRIPDFDTYLIVGRITPSTDNTNLNLNFSYDGGISFDADNNYATEVLGMGGSNSINFNSGGSLGIQNTGGGNGAGENTAFHFFLTDMLSDAYSTGIKGLGNASNTSNNHTGYIFGATQEYDTTRNLLVSGLRFKQSSGNIENAEIKIFGLLPKHTGHIGDPNT
mgnify:CR=1 FL=1|tara:strand:- start:219 stop:1226 length:1008 start_codon:yes stop_codon:yes gene_type:complete